MNKVTIKDIAKYCNVSVTTVSYVLNNSKEISQPTKERILKAAKELNFVPSVYARGLKSKKTYNIGVFIPDFDGPIHHTVLSNIAKGIRDIDKKYKLLVTIGDEQMSLIRGGSIDLAIIMDSTLSDELIKELSLLIPIVTFDKYVEGDNIYPTDITNLEGMYEETEYFIKKGSKKIAYLFGPESSYHNKLRYEGYKKALLDNNIPLDNDLIFIANEFTEQKGRAIITSFLEEKQNPKKLPFDTLICANDELAIGAMKSFQEKGYNVPLDIKIAGFDNIDKDVLVTPTLSSVVVDWVNYGREIAKFSLNILKGELDSEHKSLIVSTSLIERESTK